MKNTLENFLSDSISKIFPNNEYANIYTYSIFPTGKLFRPLISMALALDLKIPITDDNKYYACFTELHHVYTLIHDDLPCMDNDDYRRGKLSTHKKFGEWQALLAGDGLINSSYELLSKINSKHLGRILKFVTWALGPKGLIFGQYLDLEKKEKNFNDILRIHTLKTSRLIQVSLIGQYLLSDEINFKKFKNIFRLGHYLGISFQLIDDLNDQNLQNHKDHMNYLEKSIKYVRKILNDENFNNLKNVIESYYSKSNLNWTTSVEL